MKKLSIIFSLVFFAFVVTASAQSAVSTDKQSTATEKVKSNDASKAKAGCCAFSTKDCKAGSAKCCSMDKAKAEKSHSGCSGHAEATTVNEQKAIAEAEKK